ncbi:helix-turn-helix transcriptional regulator [Anaerovorax odorimutans]|nr:hypothetical protein [Anaerovorax odorimutans]
MSKPKITDEELEKEITEGKSIPDIAAKYGMTPGGVRNKLTRLHKKERAEDPLYKTYGQQQAEKLKAQTRINPNNALQEMLEREKQKNKQLLQKVKELEKEKSVIPFGKNENLNILLPCEPGSAIYCIETKKEKRKRPVEFIGEYQIDHFEIGALLVPMIIACNTNNDWLLIDGSQEGEEFFLTKDAAKTKLRMPELRETE